MNRQPNISKEPKENLIGLVKWFDSEKGYGVIGTPNGEHFLHVNNFLEMSKNIPKVTPVIFTPEKDRKKNRNTAENCRIVGELEDWKTLLYYLGESDNIAIEVEATGRGYRGNPFKRKEIKTFSLTKLAASRILAEKNTSDIVKEITDYFDNYLDKKQFFEYCKFLESVINSKELFVKIFFHFGANLNDEMLFQVWKNHRFDFISSPELANKEIQESILYSNISEIGLPELNRIKDFSFGSSFCSRFIKSKFQNISNLSSEELKALYKFLEFADENERRELKSQLDNVYSNQITNDIITQANKLETIKNNDEFNQYIRLLNLIPFEFDDNHKNVIKTKLNEIIVSKSSDDFLPELWLKGIVNEVSQESITKFFIDKNTHDANKVLILSKISVNKQFELLKIYSVDNGFERTFFLIEQLVRKADSYNHFSISQVLFDANFGGNKKSKDLVDLFVAYVEAECDNEQKYELFLKGYIRNIPEDIVSQNIHTLNKEKCIKIFKSFPENNKFIKEVLEKKISDESIDNFLWIYELAHEFLSEEGFILFDKNVFERLDQAKYFKVWENNKGRIFPKDYIDNLLTDDFEQYSQIGKWIENEVISKEEITELLFSYLQQQIPITDRRGFYTQFNHIKYLLQISNLHLERIKLFQNDLYNLILWFLDKEDDFDFEILKGKFIYFNPDEQVRIIRKLFFFKVIGKFDLTIERLNELNRFDLDLYQNNLDVNPEISVDVSTDVVIQALSSYKEKKCFLVESELLNIVLKDLELDKTRRFKLEHYFEKCLGRLSAEFNWERNGGITKVPFGENQFYYAITIPVGDSEYIYNRRGGYDHFVKNPRFEELKEAVKLLPGRKWNKENGHWGIPSRYEEDVLKFAKKYRFYLDFEGSNYENNTHLAEFKRTIKQKSIGIEVSNIPNGIQFCEGRLANKPDNLFKKEFWWCMRELCFGKCETLHSAQEWEKYTLLDFCEILGLDTDERNDRSEFIPKGHYYQFISLINRFNRLLEKLYCKDCNQILYPLETSHFAAYTVVRFKCANEDCSNNDVVYLNHCLNGKCSNIIDSRDSKKCENGLFICDSCGSCCSHDMLTRRLTNLRATGGHVHENLIKCVDDKLGHLERGEYFCYRCGKIMSEEETDIFHCHDCDIKYDTAKFRFSRPHRHLSTRKTQI
ncbi:cold shock domain-containing protein [Paludibacteraceae bacterium OttesenSCG-928-F17]|nr:cold shock domain-containing protein [Paludibacteraceae bacterium OttesenSCG-928-F17]